MQVIKKTSYITISTVDINFKTVNFTSIDNFRSFLLKPMTRAQRQNITDKGISESYINNARKVFTISQQP